MTKKELNARIGLTICEIDDISCITEECTELSIQFAIEVLEDLNQIWVGDSKMIHVNEVQNKIQELKEHLK